MQNQEEKQVTKHKAKGRPKGLRKQPDGTWAMMEPPTEGSPTNTKVIASHTKASKQKSNNKYSEKSRKSKKYRIIDPVAEFENGLEFAQYDHDEPTDQELRDIECSISEEDVGLVTCKCNEPEFSSSGSNNFSKSLYYVRPIVHDYESAMNNKLLDNYRPITSDECLRQFAEKFGPGDEGGNFVIVSGLKTFNLQDFVPDCYNMSKYQDTTKPFSRMLWCVFDKGTKLPIAIVGSLRCGKGSGSSVGIVLGKNKVEYNINTNHGMFVLVQDIHSDRACIEDDVLNKPKFSISEFVWKSNSSSSQMPLVENLYCVQSKDGTLFKLNIKDKPSDIILNQDLDEEVDYNDMYREPESSNCSDSEYEEEEEITLPPLDDDDSYYTESKGSSIESDYYDMLIDKPTRSLLRHSDEVYYPGTEKERDAYEGLSDGAFRSRNMGLSDDLDFEQDY